MQRIDERFNSSPLTTRAAIVHEYAQYIDHFIEPGYYYHLYALNSSFIMVVYSIETEMIADIWIMDYFEIECFAERVNIDDVWKM